MTTERRAGGFVETANDVGTFLDSSDVTLDFVSEVGQMARAEIGQTNVLQIGPYVLVGTEFGRVGRKRFHAQSSVLLAKERLDQAGAAIGSAITNDQHSPFPVAQQIAQKLEDPVPLDGSVTQQEIEVPLGSRAADGAQTFPVGTVPQDGRLASVIVVKSAPLMDRGDEWYE